MIKIIRKKDLFSEEEVIPVFEDYFTVELEDGRRFSIKQDGWNKNLTVLSHNDSMILVLQGTNLVEITTRKSVLSGKV